MRRTLWFKRFLVIVPFSTALTTETLNAYSACKVTAFNAIIKKTHNKVLFFTMIISH